MASVHQGYDDSRFTNPVDEHLHCTICLNVLAEPVQCRTNEHHFCRPCITRHLQKFQTCPSCLETLSVNTLRKAARYLTKNLSKLEMRCDYENRGCRELLRLENLSTHVNNCECAPVRCSNKGCHEIINKCDLIHHEELECAFKRSGCPDCQEIKRDLGNMKIRVKELREQMSFAVAALKQEMITIKQTLTIKDLPMSVENVRQDIIIAGGYKLSDIAFFGVLKSGLYYGSRLDSVERFSWSEGSWTDLPSMNLEREAASSVVYKNLMIVSGGFTEAKCETATIEAIDMSSNEGNWFDFPVTLPRKSQGHQSLVHGDRMFIIGGFSDVQTKSTHASDAIYEVCLTPPYSSKLIFNMPEPRGYHAAICFGDSIVIAGGQITPVVEGVIATVLQYDIKEGKSRWLQSLPFAVTDVACVVRQDKMILIGGTDKNGDYLNSVLEYDVKKEECTMLPPMNFRRAGCTAVITGNVIVVMGGYNNKQRFLDTAECFDFDNFVWEELPPMKEQKMYATAGCVPVLPGS